MDPARRARRLQHLHLDPRHEAPRCLLSATRSPYGGTAGDRLPSALKLALGTATEEHRPIT